MEFTTLHKFRCFWKALNSVLGIILEYHEALTPKTCVAIISNTHHGVTCSVLHGGNTTGSKEFARILSSFLFLLALDWVMKETRNVIHWTHLKQFDDLDLEIHLRLLSHGSVKEQR